MAGAETVFVELKALIGDFQAKMATARGEMAATAKAGGGHFNELSALGKGAALGIAGAAVAVGVASVKMAGDFQQNMSKLVTSGGETAANLKSDMSGVLTLMGQTGTSSQQLAQGLYVINSAGFHGAAGLTVLKAAAEGAKTENADLGAVTDGLTTLMNDYHIKASDAALVTSKMVEATSLGKTSFQDLAGSLHTVAPAADAVGLSMNEVLGAMATMTAKGTPAADAATYLRQTILQLANPSKKARDEMAALGLNSIDVSNNLGKRGLTGTLDLLTTAIQDKMGPAGIVLVDNLKQAAAAGSDWAVKLQHMPAAQQEQVKSLADMGVQVDKVKQQLASGGKETAAQKELLAQYQAKLLGMPAPMRAVLDGLIANKLGFTDLNSTIAKLPPNQQTAVAALADMVGGTKSMQAALELTGESAGTFQTDVKKIGDTTTEAGGHVAGWATVQHNFNQKLAEAKGTVEALGIKIGLVLIPFLEKVAVDVGVVVTWFEKHRAVAEALGIAIGSVLVVAVAAYTVSMAAAAVATLAATWPILAIIAAVAALGVGIYELVTHWSEVWGFIKQIASDVWDWLKGAVADVVNFITSHWQLLAQILLTVATGGIGLIPALIWHYWSQISGFTEGLWHDVSGFFTNMWHDTVGVATNLYNDVVGVFQRIMWFFGAFGGVMAGVGEHMWDWIVDGFKAVEHGIADAWNSTVGSLDFSVPSWVPVIGGNGFTMPRIPYLAAGTDFFGGGLAVVGEAGPELVNLPRGSQVIPNSRIGGSSGPSGDLVLQLDGHEFARIAGPQIRKWMEGTVGRNAVRGRLTS